MLGCGCLDTEANITLRVDLRIEATGLVHNGGFEVLLNTCQFRESKVGIEGGLLLALSTLLTTRLTCRTLWSVPKRLLHVVDILISELRLVFTIERQWIVACAQP